MEYESTKYLNKRYFRGKAYERNNEGNLWAMYRDNDKS